LISSHAEHAKNQPLTRRVLMRHPGHAPDVRRLTRYTPNINPQIESNMAKYLISFPSAAMAVPDGEWEAVGRDAHAVIDEAKAAGAYVFGGGIDEAVPPVLVSADGAVAEGGYPWASPLNGGFTVLELPSRDQAVARAARIAKACRCKQELRVFGFDPQP
jgi:hypothetical protein